MTKAETRAAADPALVQDELNKITSADGRLQAYAPEEMGPCVGSRISERFKARETCTEVLQLNASPQDVLEEIFRLVKTHGQLIGGMDENSSYPRISGVFKSGWFGGVTAVVHCEITFVHGPACAVTLTGVAREGMFNQRSARRAVRRLARQLRRTSFPQPAAG